MCVVKKERKRKDKYVGILRCVDSLSARSIYCWLHLRFESEKERVK